MCTVTMFKTQRFSIIPKGVKRVRQQQEDVVDDIEEKKVKKEEDEEKIPEPIMEEEIVSDIQEISDMSQKKVASNIVSVGDFLKLTHDDKESSFMMNDEVVATGDLKVMKNVMDNIVGSLRTDKNEHLDLDLDLDFLSATQKRDKDTILSHVRESLIDGRAMDEKGWYDLGKFKLQATEGEIHKVIEERAKENASTETFKPLNAQFREGGPLPNKVVEVQNKIMSSRDSVLREHLIQKPVSTKSKMNKNFLHILKGGKTTDLPHKDVDDGHDDIIKEVYKLRGLGDFVSNDFRHYSDVYLDDSKFKKISGVY